MDRQFVLLVSRRDLAKQFGKKLREKIKHLSEHIYYLKNKEDYNLDRSSFKTHRSNFLG
jgi:hypothetical protein